MVGGAVLGIGLAGKGREVPERYRVCKGRSVPTDIDLHIGRRLRRRRRLLNLTQQQLGDRLGIRFQQVQKYECGANRVSAARLWYLAEALQMDVSYFYDGFEDASNEADHALNDVTGQGERLAG